VLQEEPNYRAAIREKSNGGAGNARNPHQRRRVPLLCRNGRRDVLTGFLGELWLRHRRGE
jgi:hypothetical protein